MTTTPNTTESTFADYALALISLVDTTDITERRNIIHDAKRIIEREIADPQTRISMRVILRAVEDARPLPYA